MIAVAGSRLLLSIMSLLLVIGAATGCAAPEWPRLWNSYTAAFMDDQVRVIDHDAGDRTTSEGQAYGMFFALVANDRTRFDGLLRWTERNLASGDLSAHLPAWLWGRDSNNRWDVLDANSASDADVWMAYALLEAGEAWREPRYSRIGAGLATRIAAEEVVSVPGVGPVLLPGAMGFHQNDSYRLNASYLPLQLFIALGHLHPEGPWRQVASHIPALVRASAPHGVATDWVEFAVDGDFTPSPFGSYDAIRVYLWTGMLDPSTEGAHEMLDAIAGMAPHLRGNAEPPAKITPDGVVEDPRGPVGFSAALLPYLSALGEKKIESEQSARVRAQIDSKTGLYGRPAKYYDQNLGLFATGWRERQFLFDAQGRLKTRWGG
jgi:endoglucanase